MKKGQSGAFKVGLLLRECNGQKDAQVNWRIREKKDYNDKL